MRPVALSYIPQIFGPWLGLGSHCFIALQLGRSWGILESPGSEGSKTPHVTHSLLLWSVPVLSVPSRCPVLHAAFLRLTLEEAVFM